MLTIITQWGSISIRLPRLFSFSVLPFTATLGAFEGLLFWYWVDLKLGQVLLYGSLLAIVTVLTGKTALASIGQARSKGQA